jgi:cation/acetate symporter
VVAFAFGLAAASLFPAILLGIFFKRMNREGAIAGMLTGLIFTYGYIEYFKGLFLKWAGAPWGGDTAGEWLFGISPEGIGVIGMLLNIAVALAVSQLTAPPPERIQKLVESIRVPRTFDD